MFLKKLFGKSPKSISHTPYIVATRSKESPKGEKELMRIPVGSAIPQGVILGKNTILTVEIYQRNG